MENNNDLSPEEKLPTGGETLEEVNFGGENEIRSTISWRIHDILVRYGMRDPHSGDHD